MSGFLRAFLDGFVRNYRAARLGLPPELMPHIEDLERRIAANYRETVAAEARRRVFGEPPPAPPVPPAQPIPDPPAGSPVH